MGLLVIAAVAISLNWSVYVYSVQSSQVVEASLGYFINPLLTVALGVIVLSEQLRSPQWVAIALAVVGVIVIGIGKGAAPWIGLTLASSFAVYGLVKKMAGAPALTSLAVETGVLLPFAIAFLGFSQARAGIAVTSGDWRLAILMVLLGPVTAVPLLAYAAAANRLPLSLLGLTQYLTPTAIFILGIVIFGDDVHPLEWVGFAIIWVGLAVFSIDAVRRSRQPNEADSLEVAEPG